MDYLDLEKCLEKCSKPSDSCSASFNSSSAREENQDFMDSEFTMDAPQTRNLKRVATLKNHPHSSHALIKFNSVG